MEIIATGAVTLLASALTLIISQRHARKMAEATVRRANQQEVRDLLVGLLHDGREWTQISEVLLPAVLKMTSNDMMEFVDTDTGKKARELNDRLRRTLIEARLRVGNPELLDRIQRFDAAHTEWGEKVLIPIEDAKRRRGDGIEEIGAGLRYLREATRCLNDLETTAAPLLRTVLS